ncbi:MAG: hypothetical protein ACFUZC_20850 [Chthoniobacteraceae bacterium]
MKFPPAMLHKPFFPRQRGSSLVITLAFLVILTILVIGINETTRMDRTSSNLYVDRTSAALLSQNAIESVIAKLQQATADVNRHWISQPGQIVVGAEQDDGNLTNGDSRKILTGAKTPDANPSSTDARIIYLHSGAPTKTSYPGQEFLNPPNLNVATFQDPASLLITDRKYNGTEPQMIARWNYVRKDGTIDTGEPPVLTSQTNPIIGRYAYWADDESAKINYNLAWKRDYSASTVSGTLPIGHPSRVSLAALDTFSSDSALVDKLHAFLTADNYGTIANHLFNSPADARQVGSDVADALKANKFEVTHFNHDPDTTFFNEERIVLTTHSSRASGRPFLDILANDTDSTDPGSTVNLDQAKLNTVLFGSGGTASAPVSPGLIYYLSRTDWPMISGTSSFQSKYFGGNKSQLVQLALNIIDYVRSAESSLPIVEPIRGQINTSGQFLAEWLEANSAIRGLDNTFKGLTRAPMITKMGMEISTSSTPQMKMFIEVYLPKNYGTASIDLTKDLRYIFQVNNQAGDTRLAEADQVTPVTITTNNIVGGNATLTPGNRATVSMTLFFNTVPSGANKGATLRPNPGDKVSLRAGLSRYAANSDSSVRKYSTIEVVPIGDPLQATGANKAAGALCTAPASMAVGSAGAPGTPPTTALLTDDPRVSGIAKDWSEKNATWNSANPVATPQNLLPEQDTDASGAAISQASLYMPAAGSTSNPGVVSSSGELGYIHTGMQVTSSGAAGVPWRTIRLQPSAEPATVVPDWAFMDLFTAPITVGTMAKPVFAPHDTSTGGRVNVNAWAEPSTSGSIPFGGARTLPLEAVLLGARCDATDSTKLLASGSAAQIASYIYNKTTANNGKLFGYTSGYFSQGEIVEIKGVADQGEASEETVRQIANMVTARGNVFSIYTIGQALKQTPQGRLVITAENRQQTMIERYLDSSANKVRFKTVYSRPLTP